MHERIEARAHDIYDTQGEDLSTAGEKRTTELEAQVREKDAQIAALTRLLSEQSCTTRDGSAEHGTDKKDEGTTTIEKEHGTDKKDEGTTTIEKLLAENVELSVNAENLYKEVV